MLRIIIDKLNASRLCVLYNIKFAVIACICSVTDISATVTPIGVKFCMMLHIGDGRSLSFSERYPKKSPKSKIFDV